MEGLDDRYYAYIFYPGESYQMQMGWLDMQRPQAEVWFETGKGSVQIYFVICLKNFPVAEPF